MTLDPQNLSQDRVRVAYPIEINGKPIEKELPFVIGVMADLSGSEQDHLTLASRKFINIDSNNFDNVLKSIRPSLALNPDTDCKATDTSSNSIGAFAVKLKFERLEDFEPEQVARQIPQLRELLDHRQRFVDFRSLLNDDLENRLQQWVFDPDEPDEGSDAAVKDWQVAEQIATAFLTGSTEYARKHGAELIAEFMRCFRSRELVMTKDVTAMVELRIRVVEELVSISVKQIVHDEKFQSLEATWRGLEYLVSCIPEESNVLIRVMNISRKELHRDFDRAPEFDQTVIFKKLYDDEYDMPGGKPYGVIVADYYFDHNPADTDLLRNLSAIGASCYAPILVGASPMLLKMRDFTELSRPRDLYALFGSREYDKWRQLRESEDARYLGVVLPRMLMRRPYQFQQMQRYQFTMDEGCSEHGSLLWGNPAYALAGQFAVAFAQYGWFARIYGLEHGGAVEGLPTFTGLSEWGEKVVSCPTEIAIYDRRRKELENLGLVPLCHYKGTDTAVFFNTPSFKCPTIFEQADKSDDSWLASQLEYVLCNARFAQCINYMMRDQANRFDSAEEWQQHLNSWLQGFVLNESDTASGASANKPLADAAVKVMRIWYSRRREKFHFSIHLRPAFQLKEPISPITTTGIIREGGWE